MSGKIFGAGFGTAQLCDDAGGSPALFLIPDGYNLHRAEIGSVLCTRFQVSRGLTRCNPALQPEFPDNLAEGIVRVLFKETRAGIPTGSATDAR